MEITDILSSLVSTPSVSGNEKEIGEVLKEFCPKGYTIERDNLGSFIFSPQKREKNNILLDAHIDQIGFIVTDFCSNGFLRVAAVGGIDIRTLIGQRVLVGNDKLLGIFSSIPPHLQKSGDNKSYPDISSLAIDIGFPLDEVKKRVKIGDFVYLKNEPCDLKNGQFCSSGLDNKAGCAVLLYVLNKIAENPVNDLSVTVLLSSQEELGLRGAKAYSFLADFDKIISLDVSFAAYPNAPTSKTGKMGEGAMVGVSPVLSKTLTQEICAVAEKNGIKYQYEIMSETTGTNADVLSLSSKGIPTALISIPIKNMHSAVEIVLKEDLIHTADLLETYLREAVK